MTDFQVKCFLSVASKLNFTCAAQDMFVSQSSISRQISLFEEELGFPLFQRSTKAVKLTPAGTILFDKLKVMVVEWEETIAQAMKVSNLEEGSLSFGCVVQEKSNSLLTEMLVAFQEIHPEISIRKERNKHKNLLDGLKTGYYDAILIANHDVCQLSNVTSVTLHDNPLRIVMHKSHPLFKKGDISLSDLADSNFLRYKPTDLPEDKDYLFLLCHHFGFSPKIVNEYEDFEEFLYAIEAGRGVSIICEEIEILSNPNLRLIPIYEDCPQKFLPMKLTVKDSNPNKALKEFLKFVQNRPPIHLHSTQS
jgi:DNA-binding transcriptional LysR family regulator